MAFYFLLLFQAAASRAKLGNVNNRLQISFADLSKVRFSTLFTLSDYLIATA